MAPPVAARPLEPEEKAEPDEVETEVEVDLREARASAMAASIDGWRAETTSDTTWSWLMDWSDSTTLTDLESPKSSCGAATARPVAHRPSNTYRVRSDRGWDTGERFT